MAELHDQTFNASRGNNHQQGRRSTRRLLALNSSCVLRLPPTAAAPIVIWGVFLVEAPHVNATAAEVKFRLVWLGLHTHTHTHNSWTGAQVRRVGVAWARGSRICGAAGLRSARFQGPRFLGPIDPFPQRRNEPAMVGCWDDGTCSIVRLLLVTKAGYSTTVIYYGSVKLIILKRHGSTRAQVCNLGATREEMRIPGTSFPFLL